MLKADFHIHCDARHSSCSPEALIKYCAKLGFDVIAITNHDRVLFNHGLERTAKRHGLILIPGTEATLDGKHVLLLNYRGIVPKTFDELEKAKGDGAVVVAPHPFYIFQRCVGNMLINKPELFDCIEYHSLYCKLVNPNRLAWNVAKMLKKPMLGNSDAHALSHIGKTFTLIDSEKAKDDVIEALFKGRMSVCTAPLSSTEFAKRMASILMRNVVGHLGNCFAIFK